MQSVSLRYSKFLCRSMSLSDSAKKCSSIKNMTHEGQGNIDLWELSATVSSLLLSVLMKILYIFKYTYIYINVNIVLRLDLLHIVVVAFGGCWWRRSLNPCMFFGLTNSDIESHPRYDEPDATALVQVISFLKSALKVGKPRVRGERGDPITWRRNRWSCRNLSSCWAFDHFCIPPF